MTITDINEALELVEAMIDNDPRLERVDEAECRISKGPYIEFEVAARAAHDRRHHLILKSYGETIWEALQRMPSDMTHAVESV